jgi:hypothetical protein
MHHTLSEPVVWLSASAAILAIGAASGRTACADPAPRVAYAHVLANGTLDAANSRGVVAIGGGTGQYCFKLAFSPRNAVATLANAPTAPSQGVGFIKAAVPPTQLLSCSNIAKPDAVVVTGSATSINGGEAAGGYAFYAYWTR